MKTKPARYLKEDCPKILVDIHEVLIKHLNMTEESKMTEEEFHTKQIVKAFMETLFEFTDEWFDDNKKNI